MICKALFDRDMPFNPHVIFKYVKTYMNVLEHKAIRHKKLAGESFDMGEQEAAKAVDAWWSMPPALFATDPNEGRDHTLLSMIEAAVADPAIPEFDRQQAIDEIKQYLWAGTRDGADARLVALLTPAPRSRRAHPPRGRGDMRRPRADRCRLFGAGLYASVVQETMRSIRPSGA